MASLKRIAALAAALLSAGCASSNSQAPRAGLQFAPPALFQDARTLLGGSDPLLTGYVDRVGQAAVTVQGAVPGLDAQTRQLFDTRLRVDSQDGRIRAESRLELQTGDLLDLESWAGGTAAGAPSSLGRQVTQQRLSAQWPVGLGAPLRLTLSQRSETLWRLSRDAVERGQRQAQLNWAPAPKIGLELDWTERDGVAPGLLECELQGGVSFADAGFGGAQLQLRGRDCAVASRRLPGIAAAQGWSAALKWSDDARTSLHLLSLQPRPAPALPMPELDAAYELALSRAHRLGPWEASCALALQQPSAGPAQDAEPYWRADARIRRQLQQVDLTASYRAGAADDWFLPLPTSQSERVALGVDLSPWLSTRLPVTDVAMSVSWQWQRHESALGQAREDDAVHGRVRWSW